MAWRERREVRGYGDAFARLPERRRRRTTGYGRVYDMYGRRIRRGRPRPAGGYEGPFGARARPPGRPARGFPPRGVHSYDLDYGRQAGGPETEYSGRAGYPVWEPPARGLYAPSLGFGGGEPDGPTGWRRRRWGRAAFEERSAAEERAWFGESVRRAHARPGGRRGRRGRRGPRRREASHRRGRRPSRSPRHWTTEEPPGWRD